MTGFQNYEFTMVGKWLQMLTDMAPNVERVAFIHNPTTVPSGFLESLKTIGPSIPVRLIAAPVHDPAEIDAAITTLARGYALSETWVRRWRFWRSGARSSECLATML